MPSPSHCQGRLFSKAFCKTEQLVQVLCNGVGNISLSTRFAYFKFTCRLSCSDTIEPIKSPSCLMSCTVPRHWLNSIGDAVIACHKKVELYHKLIMLNLEQYLQKLHLYNGLRAKLQLPTFSLQLPIFPSTVHPIMDQVECFFSQQFCEVCIKLIALCVHKCVGQPQFISLC